MSYFFIHDVHAVLTKNTGPMLFTKSQPLLTWKEIEQLKFWTNFLNMNQNKMLLSKEAQHVTQNYKEWQLWD